MSTVARRAFGGERSLGVVARLPPLVNGSCQPLVDRTLVEVRAEERGRRVARLAEARRGGARLARLDGHRGLAAGLVGGRYR